MKNFIITCLLLLQVTGIIAQNFEGKIVFSIQFPSMNDPQTAAMLPKEAVAYFKGTKSRMEMNMMMGMKNVTIGDGATGISTVLMDMMGQKYAITSDNSDKAEDAKELEKKTKVTITNETKMIAGYKCTKALVEFPDAKDDKKTQQISLWFTKDLVTYNNYGAGPMRKIEGAVLEFSMGEGMQAMILSAKEVVAQAVDAQKFVIPEGYKKMTQEEMQKMMGGGR